jgi:futalosine hydrolase
MINPFKILYVAATSSEAGIVQQIPDLNSYRDVIRYGNLEIKILITGVGSVSTAWRMKQWISVNEKPDLAINAGIAGSYNEVMGVGDVVMPLSDCFADAGVEDGDSFLTLSEAGLANADEFPFSNGLLLADNDYVKLVRSFVKTARAITVNTATGSEASRVKLLRKFNPDIETMEGAAFFYICAMENIPFLALRSVSNMTGPRDKSKWNIQLALENLSGRFREVIYKLG